MIDPEQTGLLKRACSYCVYQERTQGEVRAKLRSWAVEADRAEEIIAWLISENYINESRYARQFAGGKFRIKKWGKERIVFELRSRGLSPRCIADAMDEIEDKDYFYTLQDLVRKKALDLREEKDAFIRRRKIARYLLGKGYASDDIHKALSDLNAGGS